MTKINQRRVGGEEIGECSVCGHKVCAHVLGDVAQVHLLRATEEALVKTAAERDEAQKKNERTQARYEILLGTLKDLADLDCTYSDGCPVFGTKHGRCVGCIAREAIEAADEERWEC